MLLSNGAKFIILLVLCAVLYLIMRRSSEPMVNIGNQPVSGDLDEYVDHDSVYDESHSEGLSEEGYRKKMTSPHAAKAGETKESHYSSKNRGGDSSELDKFFEGNHPHDNNAAVSGNDNNFAAYLPGNGEKLSDKDKFNPASLLPQEKNGEWFDDPHESTNVTSPHLINIYRPVGINTIYSTMKNPSHDIRGTIANPKQDVSPWLNSSYEPDTNIRNQSLYS